MIEQLFVRVVRLMLAVASRKPQETPAGYGSSEMSVATRSVSTDSRRHGVAGGRRHAESDSWPSIPTGVHMAPNDKAVGIKAGDRDKALETALAQIERQFGRGAVMRLGDDARAPVEVIPTGSIALDVALGIGGLPRGRIVEIYGPESSGKCLTAGTYVWTDRGLETIAEVFQRAGMKASCTSRITDISGYDIRLVNERGELETVAALTHNNRKPVLRLRLGSGRVVEATVNHPLRVMSDRGLVAWREAGQIRAGDMLVSALFGAQEAAGGDGLSEDEAVLLGYLVAEGSMSQRSRIHFTNWDPEVSGEFTRLMETLFDVPVRNYYDKEFMVHSVMLRDHFARVYGMDYVTAAGKEVPSCVRTAGHKAQRAFLSALFEGDGWIDPTSTIGLGTASEELARQVQLLLYGFGIPATVSSKYNVKCQRDYWSVTVNPAVTHRFLEEIGFRSARRKAQVDQHFRLSPRDPQFENIPHLSGLIRDLRDNCGGDREFDQIAGDLFRADMNLGCSRQRLLKIIEWCEARRDQFGAGVDAIVHYLRRLSEADYTYEKVAAVEDAGLQPTFDVVLPHSHSFLANGVLSHNTTLALHAVANAQKSGGIAAFIDAEHALDPEYAKKLGVDTDALLVSQPDTGEQALEIADMLIRSGAIDVVVIDSVAALVPRAEIEGEMGDSHVGLQARLMSQALRKVAGALNQTKTTAIFINQLREKIGVMFGSPETTTGGKALKFYASVRLDIRRIETLKDGNEPVGNRTKVKVVKNKCSPPFRIAEFDILYGIGISREGSLIDLGVEQTIVRKSGAWYTYEGDQLGQGKENARNYLRENPDIANEIEKKIKEKLGIGPRLDADVTPPPAPTGRPSLGVVTGQGGAR
jgi:protein RecA